jgi:hypothetical protein
VSMTTQPEPGSRFTTVEELEQWVAEATDEEIVAMYEESVVLSAERAEYGKELIEAAKARLDDAEGTAKSVAAAAD